MATEERRGRTPDVTVQSAFTRVHDTVFRVLVVCAVCLLSSGGLVEQPEFLLLLFSIYLLVFRTEF